MNLAAVMVSVAETDCKQKQDSKRRRADKLVFGKSSISSALLVCGNADFGWQEAGASLIYILLLAVVPISSTVNFGDFIVIGLKIHFLPLGIIWAARRFSKSISPIYVTTCMGKELSRKVTFQDTSHTKSKENIILPIFYFQVY